MSDRYETIRKVVAETLPEVHWKLWNDEPTGLVWEGGIDAYLYRGGMHQFGPASFEEVETALIAKLRSLAGTQVERKR